MDAPLPDGIRDPRELVMRISAHVGRPSLESILQALPGAELRGNVLTLEVASLNDFYRRQIKDNLSVVARAAGEVLGKDITVEIGMPAGATAPAKANGPAPPPDSKADVLERAKKEPVIQSFLDVFPGPVKAEEIDS